MRKVYYVGCFIELESGGFLFQLRDNTKKISHPNSISTFGGRIEPLENDYDSIIRELKEELSIEIRKDEIEYVGYLEKFDEFKNHFVGCTYFRIHLKKETKISCAEGSPITLNREEVFENELVGRITKEMFYRMEYLSKRSHNKKQSKRG